MFSLVVKRARDSVAVNKEFMKRTASTFISGPPGMFGNFACYSRDTVAPLYWMAPLRLAMASSFAIYSKYPTALDLEIATKRFATRYGFAARVILTEPKCVLQEHSSFPVTVPLINGLGLPVIWEIYVCER